MDALVLANMLFQGAAGIVLVVLAATTATMELSQRLEVRNWSATGEFPSVLELLEGPHDPVQRTTEVKPETRSATG